MSNFNGLGMSLGNLPYLSKAKSRSISAENFTGKKGNGGRATEGTGAECSIPPGESTSLWGSLYYCGWHKGTRTLYRHFHGLGHQQFRQPVFQNCLQEMDWKLYNVFI